MVFSTNDPPTVILPELLPLDAPKLAAPPIPYIVLLSLPLTVNVPLLMVPKESDIEASLVESTILLTIEPAAVRFSAPFSLLALPAAKPSAHPSIVPVLCPLSEDDPTDVVVDPFIKALVLFVISFLA